MLLPIGSDQTTVRRMPWVTLTILGLCVAAFLGTLVAPGDEGAVVRAEVAAVEYFLDHPYLELDPQLKGYVYYSQRQRTDDIVPPDSPTQIRREQNELDRLAAAYFAARDGLPFWRWGVVPADLQPVALVTHIFIHAGLLHLLGNLFILYLVGPAVEDAWGRPLFAAFYVTAGAVAALVFVVAHPNLAEPLIGASGAVAGVMGAFAVRYWDSRITFYYFVFFVRIYQGTFSAPAWMMLGLWAAGELAFALGFWAFFSIADLGDIGFLAHVGGFVFGVGFAFLIGALRYEERFVAPVLDRHETVHDAGDVGRALDLARQGRTVEAIETLDRMVASDVGNADAAAALWNTALATDRPSVAVPRVVAALAAAVRAGDVSLPAQIWTELVRTCPGADVDFRTATSIAEMLMREGLEGDVETTLRWLSGRVDGSTPEGILVRLARLARQLDLAAPFAQLALDRPDLPPEVATELGGEL
ncbi:MAG: rhomboid family intramembrane serine protease [Holophagae bacterium]|jgi:membrane associated rhomboid family serine protease